MRIHTTIAASANIPAATPMPIPALVPSVIFDMVFVEQILKSGPSQGGLEVKIWIDDDGGTVAFGG